MTLAVRKAPPSGQKLLVESNITNFFYEVFWYGQGFFQKKYRVITACSLKKEFLNFQNHVFVDFTYDIFIVLTSPLSTIPFFMIKFTNIFQIAGVHRGANGNPGQWPIGGGINKLENWNGFLQISIEGVVALPQNKGQTTYEKNGLESLSKETLTIHFESMPFNNEYVTSTNDRPKIIRLN